MRSAGHEAQAFPTAEEFLHDTDQVPTDGCCAIVDLHMPGMTGLELQEAINRRETTLPVIVLTASEDAELRVKALAAGAKKVLRKPCDSGVLLAAVAEAVGHPSMQSPSRHSAPPASQLDEKRTSTGKADASQSATNTDPDHFVFQEGQHAVFRPSGDVTFDQVVELVRAAIAAARRHHVRDLLVDTTGLTGFPSPDTFERFLAAVEWADEAKGGVRLAMVAAAEMIDPHKFGVIVARNRGLVSNVFTTEHDARAWIEAR
jgi:DNA-binding response OmpR family regulator